MKKIIFFVLIVAILGAGIWYTLNTKKIAGVSGVTDYKNASYQIDGQTITLVGGRAETEVAPQSASKTITQFFGNEATGDVNDDGQPDVAFLLTQTSGGSGTFFYVVVALKTKEGYQGTNAMLLGDRIAPQTTEIKDGRIVVNYADRNLGESMTTQPSLGMSKYFKVTGTKLEETKQTNSASLKTKQYTSKKYGFSVTVPEDVIANESFTYDLIPNQKIAGVSFSIPKIFTEGSNLGNDSYLSIEGIPMPDDSCTAKNFSSDTRLNPKKITENSLTYSYAESGDVGAGNYYEEIIYAFPFKDACMAVRYFFHSVNVANYASNPPREFDRSGLIHELDIIRRSLVLQ